MKSFLEKMLADEEIHSLKAILVRSNKQVVGIKIMHGYMGSGGTNQSSFCAESVAEYTAQELNGKAPIRVNKSEICALVNDVLYFRQKGSDGKMNTSTLDPREKEQLYSGDSIAYDTVSATKVVLLLKGE